MQNCQFFFPFFSEDSPHTTDNASKEQVQDSTDAPLTDARQIRKKENNGEEVQVKVTAKLGGIGVTVTSTVGEFSHIIIGGRIHNYLFLIKGKRT